MYNGSRAFCQWKGEHFADEQLTLQLSHMEVPCSSNPTAQIWKYFLMQVVLVLPFLPNPFAATMPIQTHDCGTACENSYCLCNRHKEKRGEGLFKRIFSHREERIFLVREKERELSPEQLSLFKYNCSGWGDGAGYTPS